MDSGKGFLLNMSKFKFVFLNCLLIVVAFKTKGQTNTNETQQYQTVFTTNWVKPGPYLRVVDGVTYNVAYSAKWKKFSEWEGLGSSTLDPSNDGTTSHLCMGGIKIFTNVAFVSIVREHWERETYTGTPFVSYKEQDHVVAVLSCEHPERADYYCMRSTNYISKATGDVYPAYTCGVQATNLVPVIKKTVMKSGTQ